MWNRVVPQRMTSGPTSCSTRSRSGGKVGTSIHAGSLLTFWTPEPGTWGEATGSSPRWGLSEISRAARDWRRPSTSSGSRNPGTSTPSSRNAATSASDRMLTLPSSPLAGSTGSGPYHGPPRAHVPLRARRAAGRQGGRGKWGSGGHSTGPCQLDHHSPSSEFQPPRRPRIMRTTPSTPGGVAGLISAGCSGALAKLDASRPALVVLHYRRGQGRRCGGVRIVEEKPAE